MSSTGLPAIDHTVQLTNEWLRDLMRMLDWEDKHRAYRLLRVTLQSLRDWLSVDEASNLGAQLPTCKSRSNNPSLKRLIGLAAPE